jgi:uncharacterized protein YukE
MNDLLGTILLIYGIIGIIVTLIVYGKVNSPAQKFKELLKTLAQKLGKGGDSATAAGEVIGGEGKSMLSGIANKLAETTEKLRTIATHFGESANIMRTAQSAISGVSVPALDPQTRDLELDLNFEVITDIHMREHQIPSYIVFGPPLEIDRTPVGMNLGTVTVVTGLGMSPNQPFVTVAEAFEDAAGKFEGLHDQFNQTGSDIQSVKDFLANNGVPVAENTASQLTSLGKDLKGAEATVNEMSANNLFNLIPKLVLGYFGFIHLAFVLTGIALLSL